MRHDRHRVAPTAAFAATLAAAALTLAACGSSSPAAEPTTTTSAAEGSSGTPTTTTPGASTTSGTPTAAFLTATPKFTQLGSTVPPNGDVNPYGVAPVTAAAGKLTKGDTLVSNFNAKSNVQGTGSTIVEVAPNGPTTVFADLTSLPMGMSCPGGIGLSTALAILPDSDVVVGSFPDAPGDKGKLPNADPAGCLIVLDDEGTPVEIITSPEINGPWDMTATTTPTGADLFVSDDLSRVPGAPMTATTPKAGSCTVVRVDLSLPMGANPKMTSITTIGTGYPWKANLATFIQGPTGLALGSNGTLYLAETLTNSISAIPSALTRTTPIEQDQDVITTGGGIDGPLGLATAPNGDIIVSNGNNGNLVEVTPTGKQVITTHLIPNGAGDLFGIAVLSNGKGLLTVNDGKNALDEVTFPHH